MPRGAGSVPAGWCEVEQGRQGISHAQNPGHSVSLVKAVRGMYDSCHWKSSGVSPRFAETRQGDFSNRGRAEPVTVETVAGRVGGKT